MIPCDRAIPEEGSAESSRGEGEACSTGPEKTPILPGLYVHIPFCIRKCGYCGFYSVTDRRRIPGYLAALKREAELRRGWAPAFDTLYIGGGTPSVLPAADLEGLISHLRETFAIEADAEVTVEANPGDITAELLASLGRAGVNRINLGVQSFDDASLALLGRRHSARQAMDAFRQARDAGFENIGLDLIYGLPSSPVAENAAAGVAGEIKPTSLSAGVATSRSADRNFAAWLATLETAVSLAPEHLSCYQLTLEEKTPLAERYRSGELVLSDESRQADYFLGTAQILEERGYLHYEVSNFARPGRQSRHNNKYWNHVPYLGLGPAAHSFAGRERYWNHSDIDGYIGDLEAGREPVAARETLSDEQFRLEALFIGFRTRRGICLETFRIRYGRDLLADKGEVVQRLSAAGILEIRDGYLRPTRTGMAVADSLALI